MINSIAIFNGYMAKQLLHMGHKIIDIQKNHKDKNKVVFIFEDSENLRKHMKEISEK